MLKLSLKPFIWEPHNESNFIWSRLYITLCNNVLNKPQISPLVKSNKDIKEMRMKTCGGEECVMKFRGAGKGITGFVNLMTHYLNTRRWLAGTFA